MIRGSLTILLSTFLLGALGLVMCVIGSIYPFAIVGRLCMRWWAQPVLFSAGIRLCVVGREHIPKDGARLFVGNHQSGMDIPILIAALGGRVSFMAKASLFRIPVFGWAMSRYGYVPVDRSNARQTLRNFEKVVNRSQGRPLSMVVFPESTRSRDGAMLPFRRGAFRLGKRLGGPIIPFAIEGSIHVNHPDEVSTRPGLVRLTFLPPISASDVASLSTADLCERARSCIAQVLANSTGVGGQTNEVDQPTSSVSEQGSGVGERTNKLLSKASLSSAASGGSLS